MSLNMQVGNGSRGISGKDLYSVTVMSVFMLLAQTNFRNLRLCIIECFRDFFALLEESH